MDQINNGDYEINAPEWIIGINGVAVQTLNFENNFYFHDNNNMYGRSESDPLLGETVPMLIPGYHYTNRIEDPINQSKEGKLSYDYIEFLMADGSIKLLSNVNFLSCGSSGCSNTTGIYVEPGVDNSAFAIVQNGTAPISRKIWYKPGDGLTYYYEEENVSYNEYTGHQGGFDPKVMYLKKIISTEGPYISLSYVSTPNGYGRKELNTINYVSADTSFGIGSFQPYLSGSSDILDSIAVRCGDRTLHGIISNTNGSGLNTLSRSGSLMDTRIKYLSCIKDEKNNTDRFYYNENHDIVRNYQRYPDFFMRHYAYLIDSIDYYTGNHTKFDFWNKPFTNPACIGHTSYEPVDFGDLFIGDGCNKEVTFRDNETNFMLSKRREYNKQNTLIWEEIYDYSFLGSEYYNNGTCAAVKNIITTITKNNKLNDGTSAVSSPAQIIRELNFSRVNVYDYGDVFQQSFSLKAYTSIIKLITEKIKSDDNNYNKKSYLYDIDSVRGLSVCTIGSRLLKSVTEETKVGGSSNSKTTNYSYQFTPVYYGSRTRNLLTKTTATDPQGLITESNYSIYFLNTQSADSCYNTSAISHQKVYSGSNVKLDKYFEYYRSPSEGHKGYIKKIKTDQLE